MTCADYIAAKDEQSLPCRVSPVFRSVIRNRETSADKCFEITEDIGLQIDGPIGSSTLDVGQWGVNKKEFCGGEEGEDLVLKKKFVNINLCWYAGKSVDYVVTLNPSTGAGFSSGTDISFPEPNSVSGSSAPSPIPSPAVPPPATQCYSKPESITLDFAQRTCDESSNSQVGRRRQLRRRLSHGGGKGSQRNGGQCSATCKDKCSFEQLVENPTIYVYEKTRNSRYELHSQEYTGDAFTFHPDPDEMPDCLEIEIRDSNNKKYQTVSFDVTCSENAELRVGDTFGAITIAGFNAC